VATGPSNEKTLATDPTTPATVKYTESELPELRAGMQDTADDVVQLVVTQSDCASCADDVGSEVPKLSPDTTTLLPAEFGVLNARTAVITGASKVSQADSVPTTPWTVTASVLEDDPGLTGTWQMTCVSDVHLVVPQLEGPRMALVVWSTKPNSKPAIVTEPPETAMFEDVNDTTGLSKDKTRRSVPT